MTREQYRHATTQTDSELLEGLDAFDLPEPYTSGQSTHRPTLNTTDVGQS